jgi:hypothetical protein
VADASLSKARDRIAGIEMDAEPAPAPRHSGAGNAPLG